MRLSYLVDLAAIAAIAAGLGAHVGWWLSAVVAGSLVLVANYLRATP